MLRQAEKNISDAIDTSSRLFTKHLLALAIEKLAKAQQQIYQAEINHPDTAKK